MPNLVFTRAVSCTNKSEAARLSPMMHDDDTTLAEGDRSRPGAISGPTQGELN